MRYKEAPAVQDNGASIVRLMLREINMAHKVTVRVTRIRQRIIQSREPALRQHCRLCQREVEMLTSIEAARVLEIDHQTLALLIGDGSLHTIQTVSGNMRVCKESLFLR